jgi:hypothetical protein
MLTPKFLMPKFHEHLLTSASCSCTHVNPPPSQTYRMAKQTKTNKSTTECPPPASAPECQWLQARPKLMLVLWCRGMHAWWRRFSIHQLTAKTPLAGREEPGRQLSMDLCACGQRVCHGKAVNNKFQGQHQILSGLKSTHTPSLKPNVPREETNKSE